MNQSTSFNRVAKGVKHVKVAELIFFVPMRYSSLFSNHWHLGSQHWQGASSTKTDCILVANQR